MTVMRMLALAAAAIVWAAPAAAQTVALESGQAVTVTFDARGAHFSGKSEAQLIAYDLHAIAELRGATKAGQLGYQTLKESDETPPAIVDDTVHMRFVSTDDEAVLVVDNGYGRGMAYRARMTLTDGRTVDTSICMVRPGKLSYEYWPHAIKRIELTAFELMPWQDGDQVPCV